MNGPAEVRRLGDEVNRSPVWDWPTAPCEKCGKPSRLVGQAGGGECMTCTMSFKGRDVFDMNEMHQPLDYEERA